MLADMSRLLAGLLDYPVLFLRELLLWPRRAFDRCSGNLVLLGPDIT